MVVDSIPFSSIVFPPLDLYFFNIFGFINPNWIFFTNIFTAKTKCWHFDAYKSDKNDKLIQQDRFFSLYVTTFMNFRTNPQFVLNLLTCVARFPKNVDENICICATAFDIGSENTHQIFIVCQMRNKKWKVNIFCVSVRMRILNSYIWVCPWGLCCPAGLWQKYHLPPFCSASYYRQSKTSGEAEAHLSPRLCRGTSWRSCRCCHVQSWESRGVKSSTWSEDNTKMLHSCLTALRLDYLIFFRSPTLWVLILKTSVLPFSKAVRLLEAQKTVKSVFSDELYIYI